MSQHARAQLLSYLQSVLKGSDKESDEELLCRFVDSGDEAAFTTLVKRHGPMVLRLCRRMLKQHEDAEDAFQATFFALARNAVAIRQRTSLASYLYGVAYRTALKTRRRQGRQKTLPLPVSDLSQTDTVDGNALREVQVVLDEEVMGLPDRLRLPVVLCYFQGLTQDQAARELGWSLNTCKRRLDEARRLLSERLGRRGLGLSIALLPMLLSEAAVSAVPPELLASTVKVSMLAPRLSLLAAMCLRQTTGRLKLWSILGGLVLLAGGAAGLTVAFVSRPETNPSATPPSVNPAPAPHAAAPIVREKAAGPEVPAPIDGPTALVRGKVLDAAGHAVPFAAVTALVRRPFRPGEQALRDEVVAHGKANEQGEFRLRVPADFPTWFPERRVVLVTKASGHAPLTTIVRLAEQQATEVDLRLTAKEQVIRGRLLAPDGAAAPGVRLRVIRLGDVARETTQGVAEHFGPDLGWPDPVVSDAEGRFELRGVDPMQGVWLQVEDDRYAPQAIGLRWRMDDTEGPPAPSWERYAPHGLVPEIRLEPAQVLEGCVLAADTGKPLAGVKLSARLAGKDGMPGHDTVPDYLSVSARVLPPAWLDAVSRTDGRFLLRPPVGPKTIVEIHPPADSPYLAVRKEVDWSKGVVRQMLAVELPRGVVVHGRVVDEDGNPVAGASVQFCSPPQGNPAYQPDVLQVRYRIVRAGKDGRFSLTVPAGPALLMAQGPTHKYRAQAIRYWIVSDEGKSSERWSWREPLPGERRFYTHAQEELKLTRTENPAEVRLRLVRGQSVAGRVVGPDGEPIQSAVLLCGEKVSPLRNGAVLPLPVHEGHYELPGCTPGRVYPVLFLDAVNCWGAVVDLTTDRGAGPEVKLARCGSARLRLLDAKGRPLLGRGLRLVLLTEHSFALDKPPLERVAEMHYSNLYDPQHYATDPVSDREGWLTLPALIPGACYVLQYADVKGVWRFTPQFRVEPGEQLQLPDLAIWDRQ